MPKQTIYIGGDHQGWEMKSALEDTLKEEGYRVVDMGNANLVQGDDYPDFGYAVAKRVVNDPGSHGIVICGSSAGICIVANKVKGARAATAFNEEVARSTRKDDNSNILCLPAHFMKIDDAKKVVDAWLETEFSGAERHVRRLEKVAQIENEEFGM
jgi:ribose 5-phosphate isomerase B